MIDRQIKFNKKEELMAIKPLADRVVAKKEVASEKTASGIYLGEAKEKPNYAVVSAVGPDVKHIKKGDKILFKEYSATDVKHGEQEYLIIKEEDVLATI
jgi:chaperonin GroES